MHDGYFPRTATVNHAAGRAPFTLARAAATNDAIFVARQSANALRDVVFRSA